MSLSMGRVVLDFRKLNLIQALFSKCHFSLSSPFYCYRHKSFLIMSNMQGKGQLESRGLTNQRNYTDKIPEASPRIHKIWNSICLKCHQFIISIVWAKSEHFQRAWFWPRHPSTQHVMLRPFLSKLGFTVLQSSRSQLNVIVTSQQFPPNKALFELQQTSLLQSLKPILLNFWAIT